MTAADTLDAWGIERADDVVAAARAAGLELAHAAVLLVAESSGGRNIWGRDAGSTGGVYTKGGPVTQTNYLAYRGMVEAERIGRQGVGPCQLTAADFQRQADRLGGCWRWEINVGVGFDLLKSLIGRFGERDGHVAYNGGPGAVLNRSKRTVPAAEVYGSDAMTDLAVWRSRLGVALPANAGTARPGETLTYGMRGNATLARVQAWLAPRFSYAKGLPATGNYLDQTTAVILEFQTRAGVRNADGTKPDGRTIGDRTWAQLYAHGFQR